MSLSSFINEYGPLHVSIDTRRIPYKKEIYIGGIFIEIHPNIQFPEVIPSGLIISEEDIRSSAIMELRNTSKYCVIQRPNHNFMLVYASDVPKEDSLICPLCSQDTKFEDAKSLYEVAFIDKEKDYRQSTSFMKVYNVTYSYTPIKICAKCAKRKKDIQNYSRIIATLVYILLVSFSGIFSDLSTWKDYASILIGIPIFGLAFILVISNLIYFFVKIFLNQTKRHKLSINEGIFTTIETDRYINIRV